MTYGNGGKVVNTYDAYKRLTGVKFDSETSNHFSYVYGANGGVAQLKDHVRGTTVTSEYDAANRPQRKTILEGSTHAYIGEVSYAYSANNRRHYNLKDEELPKVEFCHGNDSIELWRRLE